MISYLFGLSTLFKGEVLEGLEIVRAIESYGSQSGKTSAVIAIADSGVVGPDARSMDGADGVSDMDGADDTPPNVFVRSFSITLLHFIRMLSHDPIKSLISVLGTNTSVALFLSSTTMSSQTLPVTLENSQRASTDSDTKDPVSIV